MNTNPIAKRHVALSLAGMDRVSVVRDLPFAPDVSGNLRLDLYKPATPSSAPLPIVLFVTGYSDIGARKVFGRRIKDMAQYEDWARLVACSGLAAVTYENEEPVRDLRSLLAYLAENAVTLGIDSRRIGLWSCSGNVPNALALLSAEHSDAGIRCAVLCYGYMLDTAGTHWVADAASQYGFANPCAGMRPSDLAHVPMMIVRAGGDEFSGLNESLDRFIIDALDANRPFSAVNLTGAQHAFDVLEHTEETRTVVRQVLDFLRIRLRE
jgi:dienelactone hydrolase